MPLSVNAAHPTPTAALWPYAEKACAWIRRVAVAAALFFAGSNLPVWFLGSIPKLPWLEGVMFMRVNTAVSICAAGLSLACWSGTPGATRRRLARLFALIPLLIGALTALEDIAGVNIGIDELLASGTIPGDIASGHVRHVGRMSLNSALSLFFIGFSLLTMDWKWSIGSKRFSPAPGLAILAGLPASLGLVGYLLGITRFTGVLASTNILLHTAWSLFGLSLGVLAARPMLQPVRRILSTGAEGVLLRWTLPGSAILLLTLGWIVGRGRAAGMVVAGEGTAMMLYGGLLLIFILLLFSSRAVASQEAQASAATEALREGQERSRAIVNTALDAVVLMDLEGAIVDWNPSAERIFGWKRDEVMGRTLADIIVPEELRAAHNRGLAHLRETGQGPVFGKRLELPALRRDGQRFPVELSINPLPGAELTYFVGFIRDITERQAANEKLRTAKEAAENASRAKDHFVAALSHELRTPLTPVLLSAGALREDGRLPLEVRGQMAMIERNIALEARLIDDLLDLTRITRGKFRLRTEPCDAHSLLSHAVDIVRDDANAKNIALDLHLSAERSGVVGDPARLQQVFWNLLKNAVKFTPAEGRISVLTRDDGAQARLVIEVSDTGLGFTPEAAERIFQPFEQEGRGGDHRLGGLGLGLAIARSIVDLHGGVIRAGSPGAGKGATFTVELPGATEPPHGMLTAEVQERPGARPVEARRILLVEDHEPTLDVLTRLLQRAGHYVIPARSVAAAKKAASVETFDTLISDLGLPDGTGMELMIVLREIRPDLQAIALSGYGMEEDLRGTREAGFAAHLVKPVDFDQLRAAIARLNSVSS